MTTTRPAVTFLGSDAAARLARFARACRAAARAVSLYPASHPAIALSLSRLAALTTELTEGGAFRVQIQAATLLIDGAGCERPEPALVELADVLHRHLIGSLTVNQGADADSWRTLLLLLARPPEEVRADGGILNLWTTAGGPSLELQEIDYAEVLREKGRAAPIEQIIAAALADPQLSLDDSAMETLLDIVGDDEKLLGLMAQIERTTDGSGADARAAVFLALVRGLTQHVWRTSPNGLEPVLERMGQAAGRLSADDMLTLLAQRRTPGVMVGSTDVVSEMTGRMTDRTVAGFVAGSVIAEHGATHKLAHAFHALVPEDARKRQVLTLAEEEAAASEFGQEETFEELWRRVEEMLTSRSDEHRVSEEYGRELSNAQAVDVDRISDDPPERVSGWLVSVTDASLRSLDQQLLLDLLALETDDLRWRDLADTTMSHASDLVRVGYVDQAWELAERVVDQGLPQAARAPHAVTALERFGSGPMMKHVAAHLRAASEQSYERFGRLCRAIGTPMITPLAVSLSSEQDARSRRRLRDVLVSFGASGREAVQQLMQAANWDVRRTAAFLLREFGGSEGLTELVPLLKDPEPLVQREAVQGLAMNGTAQAAQFVVDALAGTNGRMRETLVSEIVAIRDERAAPFFAHLLAHLNTRTMERVYLHAIDVLAASGGSEAVGALKFALNQGDWWAPARSSRLQHAAAAALKKIGTPAAVAVLRDSAVNGPRAARSAARAQLSEMD